MECLVERRRIAFVAVTQPLAALRRHWGLSLASLWWRSVCALPVLAWPLCGAANMVPVPKQDAHCGNTDAYCHEWKFEADPTLRFVATGYEDGGGFYFCRRGSDGDYKLLFAVYPAMLDAEHPGKLLWGYAWDITDIVDASKGRPLRLRVAFGEQPNEEDAWIPATQRAVPYVLFRGHSTQPNVVVTERLRFQSLSVEGIQRRAMAHRPQQPTSCGGG
jgi:hypothetical protein